MQRSRAAPRLPTVPTSNAPPIPEWAGPYWYVIRCTALQARPDTSDADVARAIAFFESLCGLLPCPECRGHYTEDWPKFPYTVTQARDPVAAMTWVENLRQRIEARKAAEAKPAPVAQPPPYKGLHRIAVLGALHETRGNMVSGAGCANCGAAAAAARRRKKQMGIH